MKKVKSLLVNKIKKPITRDWFFVSRGGDYLL